MNFHGFRVPVVLLALIIGLIVFFGVQQLYNKYNFREPLTQVLEENGHVQSFDINEGGDVVRVKLYEVENIMETYTELEDDIGLVLNGKTFKLIIEDNRSEELERARNLSEIVVYEAVARGSFGEMAAFIREQAAGVGAVADVFMDDSRIYVQIKKDQYYLYEIYRHQIYNNGMPSMARSATDRAARPSDDV